jgi:chromate reductase, NAD(P)H dehydrogenase (quinone)
MTKNHKVAVLVGSLRRDSLNLKLAKALMSLAPVNLKMDIAQISDLPLYNADLEANDLPEAWWRFRENIRGADAVLFVSPEYNRSVPAALKNALDVGSRPMGRSVWNAKPGAVVTGSPGAIGGFGANHHLRQSMVFLNVPMMQQPEAYIGGLGELFDEQGHVRDDTKSFLTKFMTAFGDWIERNVTA